MNSLIPTQQQEFDHEEEQAALKAELMAVVSLKEIRKVGETHKQSHTGITYTMNNYVATLIINGGEYATEWHAGDAYALSDKVYAPNQYGE